MDVDVNEPGHDVVSMKGKERMSAGRWRVRTDLSDAIVLDDDGAGRKNSVGKHQRGARQHDHLSGANASAAPIAAASSPSVAGTIVKASIITRGKRRPTSTRTG